MHVLQTLIEFLLVATTRSEFGCCCNGPRLPQSTGGMASREESTVRPALTVATLQPPWQRGRSSRQPVEVPRALKLPRYGVLGCLDLCSFSLGRMTAMPPTWPENIETPGARHGPPPEGFGPQGGVPVRRAERCSARPRLGCSRKVELCREVARRLLSERGMKNAGNMTDIVLMLCPCFAESLRLSLKNAARPPVAPRPRIANSTSLR